MKNGDIDSETGLPIVLADDNLDDADWTKTSWDFPPYMSKEFLEQIGGIEQVEAFKTLPAYKQAVEDGLIHDDEWVGDYVDDWHGIRKAHNARQSGPPPKGKKNIHIHLED